MARHFHSQATFPLACGLWSPAREISDGLGECCLCINVFRGQQGLSKVLSYHTLTLVIIITQCQTKVQFNLSCLHFVLPHYFIPDHSLILYSHWYRS
jgi:hypothetical protein